MGVYENLKISENFYTLSFVSDTIYNTGHQFFVPNYEIEGTPDIITGIRSVKVCFCMVMVGGVGRFVVSYLLFFYFSALSPFLVLRPSLLTCCLFLCSSRGEFVLI